MEHTDRSQNQVVLYLNGGFNKEIIIKKIKINNKLPGALEKMFISEKLIHVDVFDLKGIDFSLIPCLSLLLASFHPNST